MASSKSLWEGALGAIEVRMAHAAAAQAVGLRYVTDGEAGITRKRVGRGFAYYAPDGALIVDRAERRRLSVLAIPPAWTDVWICPDPDGHIQATARDSKGRKQYRYHPRFRALRDESKFGRMLAFSESLPRLRERIARDLALPGLPRRKLLATIVRLLDKTLIRVGNDEYARTNKSYGLTTLRRRHVAVRGHTLTFEFRGKSGVEHSVAITDQRLARIVRQLHDLPGHQLFKYVDANGKRQVVDSGDVNGYLRHVTGREVTAKDFRTWSGTMLAVRALRELGPAASEREARRNVNRALDQVARRLGNTRAVCRKYYVHPAIIESYLNGVVVPPPRESNGKRHQRPTAALRRDEVVVLQFLQEQISEGREDEACDGPSATTASGVRVGGDQAAASRDGPSQGRSLTDRSWRPPVTPETITVPPRVHAAPAAGSPAPAIEPVQVESVEE